MPLREKEQDGFSIDVQVETKTITSCFYLVTVFPIDVQKGLCYLPCVFNKDI